MSIKTIQIDDVDIHAQAKAKAAAEGVSLKWVNTALLRGWVEGDFDLATAGSPVRRQRSGRRDRAARSPRKAARRG